jgi:hypothetical protein
VGTSTADSTVPVETQDPIDSVILKIWVPPQFDPAAGTPAGELFAARLEEFQAANPNVKVEVRVKAVTGVGGLLNSLLTANAAAPLVVPDLIALPQSMLEFSALEG